MHTGSFKLYRKTACSRFRQLTEMDYQRYGGVIQTREGPATFQVGDYLGQDRYGQFPVRRVKVERDYRRVSAVDTDGWADYQPCDYRLAARLSEPLTLPNGQHGEVGDYLVRGRDHQEWIVAGDLFESTYQPLLMSHELCSRSLGKEASTFMQHHAETTQRNVRALLTHTLARPTIKALTLTQPWATLLASGAKQYETRSWPSSYRGPVAIHAARGFPLDAQWLCEQDPFRQALHHTLHPDGTSAPASGLAAALPVGKVIAIALLDVLHPTERLRAGLSEQERAFGNYHDGRFAWHFAVVYRLLTPVVARGSLGLWEWVIPDACRQELEAALEQCRQQEGKGA